MTDDETIRAGAIILRDLRLFNQSAIFFEKEVEPKVLRAGPR